MVINDIRRTNARHLAKAFSTLTLFSEHVDIDLSYISRMMGVNPTKNIGHSNARKIESAFGKPEGWLDVPHENCWAEDVNLDGLIEQHFENMLKEKAVSFVRSVIRNAYVVTDKTGKEIRILLVFCHKTPNAEILKAHSPDSIVVGQIEDSEDGVISHFYGLPTL